MALITLNTSLTRITIFVPELNQNHDAQDLGSGLPSVEVIGGESRSFRTGLFSKTRQQRNYLKAVITSLGNNELEFPLPPEFSLYTGELVSESIQVDADEDVIAGSNTFIIREGDTGSTRPSTNDIYVGMDFNTPDGKLHTVTSYNATTGVVVAFPPISSSLSDGDELVYTDVTLRCKITSTITQNLRPSNNEYIRYEFTIQESV